MLDTNQFTALVQADPVAAGYLAALGDQDTVYSCFVVAGEWEYGLEHAHSRAQREMLRRAGQKLEDQIDGIWESNPHIARTYGSVMSGLRVGGKMIPTNDAWIAAVALVHGATLVTSDAHFSRIPGLTTVDWTKP